MAAARGEWLHTDYYRVLGVPDTASGPEITRAYRRRARELHPDTGGGASADRDRDTFADVAAAYEVLGDPGTRRHYDEVRAGGGRAARRPPGAAFRVPVSRADRGRRTDGPAGRAAGDDLRPGPHLRASARLTFEQAARGATVDVPVVEQVPCAACAGTGAGGGPPAVAFAWSAPWNGLPAPDGPGGRRRRCPACQGRGQQSRSWSVHAHIPAGVADGQTVRIPGHGGAGAQGAPRGDLLVAVSVGSHPVFRRTGLDLAVKIPITFPEAALGAEVPVPTVDGAVPLVIPAGTATGTTFRLPGQGVRTADRAGDLVVTVEVSVPPRLTEAERAAVEALASVSTHAPRGRPVR